jgi:hypothetical protein
MNLKTNDKTILVIPDMQIPFEHRDALKFIQAVNDSLGGADVIVNVGDEVDQMALSRFDPDPDADGAGPELKRAIKQLKPWYKAFPEMLVCESNHTARVYKAAYLAGIPEAYLRTIPEWLNAPEGWKWANAWIIDDIKFEHGDAQGGMHAAQNLAMRNRRSTVIGHHHSHGGFRFMSNDDETIFGMNVGCLIDMNSIAFRYAKHAAYKATLGCGVIINGVPYFIPMITKKNGRWNGEVYV